MKAGQRSRPEPRSPHPLDIPDIVRGLAILSERQARRSARYYRATQPIPLTALIHDAAEYGVEHVVEQEGLL